MKVTSVIKKIETLAPVSTKKASKQIETLNKTIADKSWQAIPDELKVSFAKIQSKKEKRFAKKAYKELVKYFNLEGFAPKRIKFFLGVKGNLGSHDKISNKVAISRECVYRYPNSSKVEAISHELTHCKQACELIRSPRVGIKKYSKAVYEGIANEEVKDFFNFGLQANYLRAKRKGQGEQFIKDYAERLFKENEKKLRKSYKKAISSPKLNDKTKRSTLDKYLHAFKTYTNPDPFGINFKRYENNYLEVEARKVGSQLETYFETFEKFFIKSTD